MRGKAIPVRVRETGAVYGSLRAAIAACGYKPTSFIRQVQEGRPLPGGLHLDPIDPTDPAARSVPRLRRKSRRVINLTTGEVYPSARDAAAALFVSQEYVRLAISRGLPLLGDRWAYLPEGGA